MNKIIAVVLIFILAFGLMSCEIVGDIPGFNYSGNPNARYWGTFVVESYDDLMLAWDLRTQNDSDGKYNAYYSFDGVIGEGYTTLYYFSQPDAWITPTTDMEKYFKSVSNPSLDSYIFYTSEGYCSCSNHELFTELSGEKYYEYEKYPYITIIKDVALKDGAVEINDTSLLTLNKRLETGTFSTYDYSYNGVEVFKIQSCRPLSDAELEELVNHIIVLK